MKTWHGRIAFLSLLSLASPAFADGESVGARTSAEPSPPSWTESQQWGWFLIGSSLALGAALTATGLAVDCNGDHDCRVETSALVWGGLGLASTGSMFGFIVLQRARTPDPEGRGAGVVLSFRGQF